MAALSPTFDAIYADGGRLSIPREQLLRALLLQVLYTIRSERYLIEQLQYNLLYRWFVGLGVDDPIWDLTVFTKNRERLLMGEVAESFFGAVLAQAKGARLLSPEHRTVDGTLVRAWAGQKSFRRDPKVGDHDDTPPPAVPKHRRKYLPPDDPRRPSLNGGTRNPTVNLHGERRSNATHTSTTDPNPRLAPRAKAGSPTSALIALHEAGVEYAKTGLPLATGASVANGSFSMWDFLPGVAFMRAAGEAKNLCSKVQVR